MAQLNKLSPTASLAQVIAQVNDAFRKISDESQVKVINASDTGNPAIILGKLPTGTHAGEYHLVIAKSGENVLDNL